MISSISVTDWSALCGISAVLLGALGYFARLYLINGYATKNELDDHSAKLASLYKRTEALEAQSNSMATRDDVNRVLIAIERADGARSALAAEISGVRELLSAFQRQLNLIQQSLLSGNSP
jgi:hypothetical protein